MEPVLENDSNIVTQISTPDYTKLHQSNLVSHNL